MDASTLQSILGSKTVSFYSIFAKAIGSVQAAVWLSQAFFWQEKARFKNGVDIGGEIFFQKTAEEWYEETGLTKEQQMVVRKHLKGSGIVVETLAGLPATVHYRVDIDALVAVINRYLLEGVQVAVKHRNKKPSNPRTTSGKFRQPDAVEHGNINNKESLERKKREKKESMEPQAALSVTTHTPQPPIENTEIKTVEYTEIYLEETSAETTALQPKQNPSDQVKEIVEYLNEKTGSSFRHTSKATAAQIKARFKEGYTVEDLKAVIAFKSDQWGRDAKMSEYLRPSTLFRPSHFEGYLQAAKKSANGNGAPAQHPTATTPDELLNQISAWYHANPEIWHQAKQFAGVETWTAAKIKTLVQQYCARQISDGKAGDTFEQHNGRLQTWMLRETKQTTAGPSPNGNGRVYLEPKFREA